jgi:hypothetical protein
MGDELMLVNSYDAYKYVEVVKILQMKEGAVYRTKPTGKFVLSADSYQLPKGYSTTSISTSLLRKPKFELDIVSTTYFS